MQERKPFPFKESNYTAEVPCNYCRVFKSRSLELCKSCGIYQRRLAEVSVWLKSERETGVGNTLPLLNLAIQQLVSLLRQQGIKHDQMAQMITKLVQDSLADSSKRE